VGVNGRVEGEVRELGAENGGRRGRFWGQRGVRGGDDLGHHLKRHSGDSFFGSGERSGVDVLSLFCERKIAKITTLNMVHLLKTSCLRE